MRAGSCCHPQHYDDGGISGGTIERPALKRLFDEIDAGRIDMVVVYKVDRLTRSLADFAKLVERLDAAGASFVSVTQQFNTSTSMGRLTLNVLLSFAQFEREVTAERIRDKIAASKKKGMWMGGLVPLGFETSDSGLVINKQEAETICALYEGYLKLGCVRRLKTLADERGLHSKLRTLRSGKVIGGKPFTRGHIYQLLSNPIYIGKVRHKGEVFDGLHDAIIDQGTWDRVQSKLAKNRQTRVSRTNTKSRSPLAGKLFDTEGDLLTPSHTNKKGRRYRYYISRKLIEQSGSRQDGWRIPATEIERAVVQAVKQDRDVRMAWSARKLEHPGKDELLEKINRVQIHQGYLEVVLNPTCEAQTITITALYTMRRRGVETKLLLDGGANSELDATLAKRILQATDWFEKVKSGIPVYEIAKAAGLSADYVAQNIELGFLAPKILAAIIDGTLPPHLNVTTLSRMQLPVEWPAQEALLLV